MSDNWGRFRCSALLIPDASAGATVASRRRGTHLTHREREVTVLVARGYTNRQIADELVITAGTVERHVANICNKLGFRSHAEIARWAGEHGLLAEQPA